MTHRFIPESCRWLLTKGRKDEAKELLQKAAKVNQVVITDETLEMHLAQRETESSSNMGKPSVLDLMRYPNLRRKTLLLCCNWLVHIHLLLIFISIYLLVQRPSFNLENVMMNIPETRINLQN